MRQVVFGMVILATAFLGGAVVNGPGLKWMQARLLDYMGLRDGGEISFDRSPTYLSRTSSRLSANTFSREPSGNPEHNVANSTVVPQQTSIGATEKYLLLKI